MHSQKQPKKKKKMEHEKQKPNWICKDMVHNPNIKPRKGEIGVYYQQQRFWAIPKHWR